MIGPVARDFPFLSFQYDVSFFDCRYENNLNATYTASPLQSNILCMRPVLASKAFSPICINGHGAIRCWYTHFNEAIKTFDTRINKCRRQLQSICVV